MSFEDRFCATAEDDLDRLFDFFLDGTKTIEDIDLAGAAIEADRLVLCTLPLWTATPCTSRKAGKSPTRRELIVPFGAPGYAVLFEIASPSKVLVLAVRHQREEDDL